MREPAPAALRRLDRSMRRALRFARYEASRGGREAVGSEDLLLGLCRLGDGAVDSLLEHHGAGADRLLSEVLDRRGALRPIAVTASLPLSSNCRDVLEAAAAEARARSEAEVDSLCVVLGMLATCGCRAGRTLRDHGLRPDTVALVAREVPDGRAVRVAGDADEIAVAPYGRELVGLAAEGRFDPIVGRETELARLVKVLSRRSKNNPILVGEPGVGKTALVEGLAQRVHEGQVPRALRNKKILALDLSAVVAGTRYRGEFEERLQGVLDVVSRGEWIVFVDEVHTLIGAGATEGTLDAANIMKGVLARGEVSCIGATTAKEFRRFIERDRALQRRFQQIRVPPSTAAETLSILAGIRPRYEEFHRVRFEPESLDAAVSRSVRFLPNRELPDKAIDVLDEAAAWARIEWEDRRSRDEAEDGEAIRVRRRHVDEVIEEMTGIPVRALSREERTNLASLETQLGRRVVGQDPAIAALARAIRRSRVGLRARRRPIGSFLLVGPSGVGKTELARRLAEILFGEQDALVHLDMSEYSERHSVAKLIGAPPGYVGSEDGGRLTERIRNQPYSVVLFDEVEKAHPDLQNLLLQILEDGRLTDADGTQATFRECVVLLTSNVGGRLLASRGRAIGFSEWRPGHANSGAAEELDRRLERSFRPELLNRIDRVVPFRPLADEHLEAIADLMIEDLNLRLGDRGVEIQLEDSARRELVARTRQDPGVGARGLRRALEREVVDPLAGLLLDDGEPGSEPGVRTVVVSVEDGALLVSTLAGAIEGPNEGPIEDSTEGPMEDKAAG